MWGYNYRTLEGHFERGQIDFMVHKNLTTGRVWFHIHAVSQTGRISNPVYWLGFKTLRPDAAKTLFPPVVEAAEAAGGADAARRLAGSRRRRQPDRQAGFRP